MNTQMRKAILKNFCEPRGLSSTAMSEGLVEMLCATTAPYFLMIECLDQLDPANPYGFVLAKLIDRTYETAAGSLALIALKHFQEAEILSRSVLESAATVSYIASQHPPMRLAQFFHAYVGQERDQNRKWGRALESERPEVHAEHRARIDQKNKALDHYEAFIKTYARHCDLDFDKIRVWPGLIDRLTELGRGIDYRTVYAAMCSQTHHDAEDVLNQLMVHSMMDADHMAARMKREKDTFSIFMVLFALKWFVEATCAVCVSLHFPTATAQGRVSLAQLERELQILARHLDSGDFPKTWTPRPASRARPSSLRPRRGR